METTLLALSATDLAIGCGLAAVCVISGWQMQRIAARGREAALRRSLFEAKGVVPQLESAARHHEQRAETLELRVKALRDQLAELDASLEQKDTETARRDREIRSLTSELTVVKEGTTSGTVLVDGLDPPAGPDAVDPQIARRHAALEARYEAMKRGLIQRDDRIAELEEQLRNPSNEVPTRTLEQQLSELEQSAGALKDALAERETQLELLQARLQEEVAQREALEDLARRRSEGNRELKAAAAEHQRQIPELTRRIEARNAEIAERDGKLRSLEHSLRAEQRRREAGEVEVRGLHEQLAAEQSRQRELERRQAERDEAHQRAAAALQRSIEDRQFKIDALEAEASRQSAKLEMLRSTFFEAKNLHRSEVASLEQQLADRDAAIAAEKARNASVEDILSARELALTDLELAADGLRREVADLAQRLAASRSALARCQCAILWLVARLGASIPLLPAPDAEARWPADVSRPAANDVGVPAPAAAMD